MRYIDILSNFEREINKFDDTINKPSTDDSLYWLNQAVSKFVKLRFNGDFVHHTGYEETEKRYRDLVHLLTYTTLQLKSTDDTQPSFTMYSYDYPHDFMYTLSENIVISDLNDEHSLNTFVFECTADSFMARVNNSLTDFHYRNHRARPLRIRTTTGSNLLTDKNYKILTYNLQYLRQPNEIVLTNPFDEYTDFDEIILPEIIKMAAQMYIENTKDQRYNTLSNEVNTQE